MNPAIPNVENEPVRIEGHKATSGADGFLCYACKPTYKKTTTTKNDQTCTAFGIQSNTKKARKELKVIIHWQDCYSQT